MTDENEGRGGSYVIDETGARKLIERTLNPGDDPPIEPAAPDQPATAGFFSPVAPAEQPTTTE
jgi:hypothetical protein